MRLPYLQSTCPMQLELGHQMLWHKACEYQPVEALQLAEEDVCLYAKRSSQIHQAASTGMCTNVTWHNVEL